MSQRVRSPLHCYPSLEQQRSWTAEDASVRSVMEVLARAGAESAVADGDDDLEDEEPEPLGRVDQRGDGAGRRALWCTQAG